MKRILLPMVCLGLSSAIAANAQTPATVVEGSFHCFPPGAPVNYVPSPKSGNHLFKSRRVDKLGDSKWDNTDGHDLREIPTEGSPEILVILVEFQNVSFSKSIGDPREKIDEMLNGENYDFNGAQGSARNFYSYTSAGKFTPKFNVLGPVKCSKIESEYVTSSTPDFKPGTDEAVYAPSRMIEEAIRGVDDQVDFSKYDTNGDGYVDFVYVFFAGRGATTGGNRDTTVWPHAFTLTSGLGAPVELDGVKIDRYCCSAELGSNGKLSGIGTFCHEFGHVLGLPDLYDTANNGTATKCFTPGVYDCMDGGNNNNNEHSPATFSLYEQYALEWTLPVTINGSADLTLLPLAARPFGYKIPTLNNDQEYFLLESRGPIFNDKYLPGHGMLAWHIDFVLDAWTRNIPNNTPSHQRIDIEEADNKQDANSRSGDVFPGNTGKHELQSYDSPALADWKNNSTGYEITQIARYPDGTVSFHVEADEGNEMAGTKLGKTQAEIVKATTSSARLQWAPVAGATGYMVSVYDLAKFDGVLITDYVDGFCFRNVGQDCNVEIVGLEPGKKYGAYVYALNDVNASRPDFPVEFATLDGASASESATNLYAHADNDIVTLTWDALEGVEKYELTVALPVEANDNTSEKVDFSGNMLPEGWKSDAGYESRDKYCGIAAPALRTEIAGQAITSSKGENTISELSFWARCQYDDVLNLDVYGIDAKGNRRIIKRIENIGTSGAVFNLPFPEGLYQAQIVLGSKTTGGTVFIDDIELTRSATGMSYAPVSNAVINYGSLHSATVEGLDPNVEYCAYVTPMIKSGEGLTAGKRSNVLTFIPSKALSGVDKIEDGLQAVDFNLYNGVIVPTDSSAAYDVFTIDGMRLAGNICGEYTLPQRGIYILRSNGNAVKICW
ncbi:MAG: M6 family metalloprotease domain-containing protein [Muribaculaceae bacterium]|nr:M6 family metalloprotease domain-containing protein [Muribaculaceae bacterium]